MLKQIKRLVVEDSGMEMLEWAVVAVLFAVAAAATFRTLGGRVTTELQKAVNVFNPTGS